MKSNYKRIGDYIREVKIRNKDLSVTDLRGINIDKYFMPSVANTIGTDMSKYKVVKKGQFACNRMHVGRDKRLPVALHLGEISIIVSPAYTVFEVIDESLLNPEYLMMWFSRKEFDRESWFYTDSDVRGGLSLDDFFDIKVPILPIEKQREIVKEYKMIMNRIQSNELMIEKLEYLSQSIFKENFIDVDENWDKSKLEDICTIGSSKRIYFDEYTNEGIAFYRGSEVSLEKKGLPIKDKLYISNERYNDIKNKFGVPVLGDLLLTAVGTIGESWFVDKEEFYFKDGNVIWLRDFKNKDMNYYIYLWMQSENFKDIIKDLTIGSTQSAITIKDLSQVEITIPEKSKLDKYMDMYKKILNKIIVTKNINMKLREVNSILLSKIASMGE